MEREKITAEEFIEKLLKEDELENYEIEEDVNIFVLNSLHFSKTFHNIKIKNIKFSSNLVNTYFSNCEIDNLEIIDCEFNPYNRNNNSNKFEILFYKSHIFRIYINGIICNNKVNVDIKFINDEYHFENTKKRSKIQDITIKNCDCIDEIYIRELDLENIFSLSKLNINKLTIGNFKLNKFNVSDCKISYFSLGNTNIIDLMSLRKNQINSLTCICSSLLMGTINFQENKIKELLIYNDNSKGSFIFQKCSIELLKFENFFNYGNVLFSSCEPLNHNSTIEFINSNLGKMQFFDFSFKSFKEIKIKNTYLSEIVPTNVEWFEDHQLAEIELKQKRELYRQLKLATEKQSDRVSALHFQAEEMTVHKKIISNEKEPRNTKINPFNTMWLIVNILWLFFNFDCINFPKVLNYSIHFVWLSVNVGWLFVNKPFSLINNKNLNDNFSLWTGKTNDFGQNWIKPTFLAFISTLVFYVFVIIAYSPNIQLALCQHEWNNFFSELYEHSKILAQMFNPTFSSKAILNESYTSAWAYVLLEIHRIFLGFFIFQTINAFRKFFKAG